MLKKLNIGIDIDDVLADTCPALLTAINLKFGSTIALAQMSSFYTFTDFFDGDTIFAVYNYLEETYRDDSFQYSFAPIKDSIEVINRWAKEGHAIHYITARPGYVRDVTTRWLFDHGYLVPGATVDLFDNTLHETEAHYKASIVEHLGLDVMIEDSLGYIEYMKLPVLLLDKPWNQGKLPERVKRMNHWRDMEKEIIRLMELV
jgi:uncharacterized HAD superfamily protein